MNLKKAKYLIFLLFSIDLILSVGTALYKNYIFETDIYNDIPRLLVDLLIFALAYAGIKFMKSLYMFVLLFSGVLYIMFSIGIFISEDAKLYGLMLLIAGLYFLLMFLIFVYSKGINEFFNQQHARLRKK